MERAAGLKQEIDFWDAQLSGTGDYSPSVLSRFDMSKQPPVYRWDAERLVRSLARRPRILDVGSGPASVFAWGARQGRFALVAADPLAHEYRRIADRYGLEIPCKTIARRGEDLRFWRKFHLTWCHNAIDHAEDPQGVFSAMVRATRRGGVIAVQCFEKEGTANAWEGLHQTDVSRGPNGEFVCTRKDGSSCKISDPRAVPIESCFDPVFHPKPEGRDWLVFLYRKV